jgi:hypothetical protein
MGTNTSHEKGQEDTRRTHCHLQRSSEETLNPSQADMSQRRGRETQTTNSSSKLLFLFLQEGININVCGREEAAKKAII